MQYTQELTLDVARQYTYSYIQAKQGDDASRYVKITVTANGVTQAVPTTATATFRALKPDGKSIYNSATINSDGTVTVELTEQTLAVPGRVMADVSITDSGTVLSVVSFCIDCLPAPLGENIDSETELLVLTAALEKTDAALEAEAARVTAENARVAAEKSRASAENARVSAEQTRQKQETARVSAESARVTAEKSRVTAEEAREKASSEAVQAAEEATADCITATKSATDAVSALLNQAATLAFQLDDTDGGLNIKIFEEDT